MTMADQLTACSPSHFASRAVRQLGSVRGVRSLRTASSDTQAFENMQVADVDNPSSTYVIIWVQLQAPISIMTQHANYLCA